MRGFSKALSVFDKVIELAEMGEEIENIARTVRVSGTMVKTLIAIERATKEGRIIGYAIDKIPRVTEEKQEQE